MLGKLRWRHGTAQQALLDAVGELASQRALTHTSQHMSMIWSDFQQSKQEISEDVMEGILEKM